MWKAGALALAMLASAALVANAGKRDPHYARERAAAAHDAERKGDYFAAHNKPTDAKAQWTDAAADLRQAIDASDDVELYYLLAVVENKLGQLGDAYKHLQVVTNSSGVKPDIVKKAQAALDDLSGRVGTVKLTVTPDGAQVAIGGNIVGTTPLTDPLVLPQGTYTITLTEPGYQPKDLELKVIAGGEAERKVALDRVPIAVTKPVEQAPVAEPEPAPSPASPLRKYIPGAIGGAVTIGFIAAATATGVTAIHWHDKFVNPSTPEADRASDQHFGRRDAHLTDGFIAGAAIAAVATAGYYYFTWSHERSSHESSKVTVAPWVQSTNGGLAVAGSF